MGWIRWVIIVYNLKNDIHFTNQNFQFYSEHNSWEPEKNIAPFLVDHFEKELKQNDLNSPSVAASTSQESECDTKLDTSDKTTASNSLIKNGLDLGLEPEKIIAANNPNDKLMYLVKWANSDSIEEVPADDFKRKFPELVVHFYIKHLEWTDGTTLDDKYDLQKNDQGLDDFNFLKKPEKIFGSKYIDGELKFIMKWVNSGKPDLVLAKIAIKKCPYIVIKFCEEHIKWGN